MAEYVNKSTLYSLCEPRGVVTLHVSDIDAMHSADVAPVVHARWVDKGWAGDSNWEIDGRGNCWRVLECSHCKGQLCGRPKSLNCPECGAKMEVEQQNEPN